MLFDVESKVSKLGKKIEDAENTSLKVLAKRFWLTWKSCSWFNKVVLGQSSIK